MALKFLYESNMKTHLDHGNWIPGIRHGWWDPIIPKIYDQRSHHAADAILK